MKAVQEIGLVVAAYGRHYGVMPQEAPIKSDGSINMMLRCFVRSKDGIAVGDRVHYTRCSPDQGIITATLPRQNLLYRSEGHKSRRFAANLDQVLIMLAVAPRPNEALLGRMVVASQAQNLPVLIVLNKVDLGATLSTDLQAIREMLEGYKGLPIQVLELSLATESKLAYDTLTPYLAGRTTLLIGQSGTGKSTLINHFAPYAKVLTQEISQALGTGKHTTTATHLYDLGILPTSSEGPASKNAMLIDSPGFQTFGLDHLQPTDIERVFAEFQPWIAHCRFYNCKHLQEPDCAVRAAVQAGQIAQKRYALYQTLVVKP